MRQAFRWYGPEDSVSLEYIRQSGADSVFSSLHQIPYGEPWPLGLIQERQQMLEAAGLKWAAVESLPVHEDIKYRGADYKRHIENYKQSLINIGKAGIPVVIYNFMPVLDWVRTDMNYKLKDGSECLFYDPAHFAAFDLYSLNREGAEDSYRPEIIQRSKQFFESLGDEEKHQFEQNIIDVFPGTKMGLTIQNIKDRLDCYKGIDPAKLKENFRLFLQDVVPAAAQAAVNLAVHPDDPPWSIMGLPRIVSCAQDIRDILGMHENEVNGLCFCSGSYSARDDNALPEMIREFGSRIHAVHLRSTQRHSDGSFSEANHLEGSVDMYEVVLALLEEQRERQRNSRTDWQLAFRPDHGHRIMDDLKKKRTGTPGYSAIGRMKSLSEIRGLQYALSRSISSAD